MFVGQSYAKIDPETAVGIWCLDSKEAKDSSKNGLDGKIFGSPELVEGEFGKALDFDKGDYVEVTHSPLLEINDEITIVMWAKGSNQDGWHRLLDKRSNAVVGWEIQAWNNDPGFGIRIDTTDKVNQCYKVSNVFDDTWHHVAYILDNGTVWGYKDGVKVINNAYQHGKGFSNQDNLQIGTTNFKGALDDVAIFNVALTDDDINSIMTVGLKEAVEVGNAVSPAGKLTTTTWSRIKYHR